MASPSIPSPSDCFGRASYGELTGWDEVVAWAEASASPADHAWAAALRAQRWVADPGASAPPAAEALAGWVGAEPSVSDPAALAVTEIAKACLIDLDREGFEGWLGLLSKLTAGRASSRAQLRAELLDAWRLLLSGHPEEATTAATAVHGQASKERVAAVVIDASTLRAFAALTAGDLAEATMLARRASRMARTEGMPQPEYLAHLVLARVRRMTGHPHLATRILEALVRVASPVWAGWIRWELVFSGSMELAFPGELPSAPAEHTSHAWRMAWKLAELHHAAERGDRPAFDATGNALARWVESFPPLRDELEAARSACDPRRAPIDPEVASWITGTTAETPAPLHGLCTRTSSDAAEESAMAYALRAEDGSRRRVMRLGRALAESPRIAVLRQTRRKQGRVETILAVLVLAMDDGVDEAVAFEEVYGFSYEPEIHKGVFDVLLHRTREYLGEHGRIERTGGRVRLFLGRPILVPDPRCSQPIQDQLLRAIAAARGATAKDVAKAIGVSVRTAQAALTELAADGACLVDKDGRRVAYRVEDTTFSEPTQHT
jgi:hypothetical protein